MNTPIVYLIAHTPCSGALWLCDVLARNGLGIADGNDASFFIGYGAGVADHAQRRIDTFFADRLAQGGGVCGLKTDLTYLEHLAQHIRPLDFKASIFSHVTHYIHLTREDVAAQAVAWYIASHTGQWTTRNEAQHPIPPYDGASLSARVSRIQTENQRWQQIIEAQGVEPLPLTYESLVKFGGLARAIKALCKHADVALPKPINTGENIEALNIPELVEYGERYRNGE